MAAPERKPYTGTEKSLVIGIDIGTTLSGVSYALLEPGKVPQRIQIVTKYPGQADAKPNARVPSVVCYDEDGNVIAIGPQTDPEVNPALSEMEGVRRAEWFKLRLRPPLLAADKKAQLEEMWLPPEPEVIDEDANIPDEDEDYEGFLEIEDVGGLVIEPEPPIKKKIPRPVTDDLKTPLEVFADFLHYIFKSAKEYIIETEKTIDPTFTWSSIEKNIYFVLTHPNGWEGKQQSQMRDAAVVAGLVDRSTAADRVTFVTEGEANLHFCLDKNPDLHHESGGLLVVDCGGGTVDLSAYSRSEKGGFKEIVSPDCLLQGSIFVTSRARDHFKGRFKDSKFESDDDVEAMARAFDKLEGAKCMFSNPETPYYVKFGGLRDNDRKYGITGGKFKVDGAQVAKFFEPAVQDIIGGIQNQCNSGKDGGVSIKFVLLVGGFGRSDYLYARLREHFKSNGVVVLRSDNAHLDKSVADGAVSWYLGHHVSARIARNDYGVMIEFQFDSANPEHVRRESTKFRNADGNICIPGGFSTILKRNTQVFEKTEFRQPHCILFTPDEFSRCSLILADLKSYRGQHKNPPEWIDLEPGSFHDICTIQVAMAKVKASMKLQDCGSRKFYELNLELVIQFSFTELRACIAWQEDGVEKRTPASIFYD